jgi:hypothetical protein
MISRRDTFFRVFLRNLVKSSNEKIHFVIPIKTNLDCTHSPAETRIKGRYKRKSQGDETKKSYPQPPSIVNSNYYLF